MVRIKQVTENRILFTNGDTITYDHIQDCCEHNYADFEQIDDIAYQFESPLLSSLYMMQDFGLGIRTK